MKLTKSHIPAPVALLLPLMFVAGMVFFVLQKLFFLSMTDHEALGCGDMVDVVLHGMPMDASVVSYLLVLPWLLMLFANLVPEKITERLLNGYVLLISFVVSCIVVADASLYDFWQFKLDSSIFIYTDKPGDAFASVSAWYIVVRLVMILAGWMLMNACFIVAKKINGKFFVISPVIKWLHYVWHLLLAVVLFVLIRGGIGEGTMNVSRAYYCSNQYLNHAAVNPVFSLIYSLGKAEEFSKENQFYPDEELDEIMQGIYHTESLCPDTLLTTSRPDILLIVWEGCCKDYVGILNGGKGVTPGLDSIASGSVHFSNCYASSYRTDRGLVCLMAGYLGLPTTSLMKMPAKNANLPALPKRLAEAGYSTTFWYGGDISFTNMRGYMYQAGFGKTYGIEDFPRSAKKGEWGLVDGELLRFVTKAMKEETASPSFHAVMTLSSHEPWDVPIDKYEDERQNAFHYSDLSITAAINELRNSPKWDNLLVIITADHGVAQRGAGYRNAEGVIHLPMVWTGGAVKQQRQLDMIMNQSDLAATLLGQLGIAHDEFFFSRDVLSKGYTYPTASFCFNDGIIFMDSTGRTVYDNSAGMVFEGFDSLRTRKAKGTMQLTYKKVGEL